MKNATDTDKANHKGLQVYNTETSLGEGVYTWDGTKWAARTGTLTLSDYMHISGAASNYQLTGNSKVKVGDFQVTNAGVYEITVGGWLSGGNGSASTKIYLVKNGSTVPLFNTYNYVFQEGVARFFDVRGLVSLETTGSYEVYFESYGTSAATVTANFGRSGHPLYLRKLGF